MPTKSAMEVRSLPRKSVASTATDVDPALFSLVETWPHLREFALCLQGEFVYLESKYGQFQRIQNLTLDPQTFEAKESDPPPSEFTRPDIHVIPSNDDEEEDGEGDNIILVYGGSPMLAYDPTFNWKYEKANVPGQRVSGPIKINSTPATRFSVRILAVNICVGLVEPLYGTMCLYSSEKKEKLSEDFHFQFLPEDWPGESTTENERAIFSVEVQSPSVCLLVQLEKPASEETSSGVKSSVYTRKDPPTLTEKEAIQLGKWARNMSVRESFAWITIPLFDSAVTGGVGGFGTPDQATPGTATTRSGSATPGTPRSTGSDETSREVYDFGGPPVLVDIPNLNRVKECYSEDQVLDIKRKAVKPIRATMRFEIERLALEVTQAVDFESSLSAGYKTPQSSLTPSVSMKETYFSDFVNSDYDSVQYSVVTGGGSLSDFGQIDGFRALDFQSFMRTEPSTQLLHSMFVYPQAISLPKKFNLFVKVELKTDDLDIQKPALEAMCPSDSGGLMLRFAFTQVAAGARLALFHDEVRVRLPALLEHNHHFLFTFFHIDLTQELSSSRRETVVGYAVLPLSTASQSLRSELSLQVAKELQPHYLDDAVQKRMSYWEDGRHIFRLRTRLCSSLLPTNENLREFIYEYDQHVLEPGSSSSDVLEVINSLKTVDLTTIMQFLFPVLNMLLCMIGNGMETLQVAAFRALVSITTRVQAETGEGIDRNPYLVHFVDYIFDDSGRRQTPVYPGLCNVWRSLARSKAKGYKVGPVYDEALLSAWVILEIISKSMSLELAQVPHGGDIARLRLEEEVYQCIWQLFDCLLTEVQERVKRAGGTMLSKRLNSAIAFFCYDLLSVVDPPQVFELVGVYLTKFAGECPPVLHRFKLIFLRILCDHDFYVETPGRIPAEKNYLTTVLLKEIFLSLDHEDVSLRTYAARILCFLICKHEYDERYQLSELKLYVAQLYSPFIALILEEVSIYDNLGTREKRDILISVMTILRSLDDDSLHKIWKQNTARLRVFFQLLEDGTSLFYPSKIQAVSPPIALPSEPNEEEEISESSHCYTERLAQSVNHFVGEASKRDAKTVLERDYMRKLNSAMGSKSYLSPQTHLQRREITRHTKDGLPASLRKRLDQWESRLWTCYSAQTLRVLERFSEAVEEQAVCPDYDKCDNFCGPLSAMLRQSQPLSFWHLFPAVFYRILRRQSREIMGPGKDRLLKDLSSSIMKRMTYQSGFLRQRAVLCLFLLIKSSLETFGVNQRLKACLTVTISDLISDRKLVVRSREGQLVEVGELPHLRHALDDLSSREICTGLMYECGVFSADSEDVREEERELNALDWDNVAKMSLMIRNVLDASVQHARLLEGGIHPSDKYSVIESYYSLASAYKSVVDLHMIWLLQLREAHQENQAWAEAAQCAMALAAVVMKALHSEKRSVWSQSDYRALNHIQCQLPEGSKVVDSAEFAEEVFGGHNLNIDSAVKYLQMSSSFFKMDELYHYGAQALELTLPVYQSKHAYGQLVRSHQDLTGMYELAMVQESSPIPFKDATYYRVAFYGAGFGDLNQSTFIYREARDVRLGDIIQKLTKLHETQHQGSMPLSFISDSREVDTSVLEQGVCYIQVTAVEPVVGSKSDRWLGTGPQPSQAGAPSFSCFLFDSPFTLTGKTQGGLEDQWKRRTLLYTKGSFPSLLLRLPVAFSESRDYSPIQNAISVIESRARALATELDSQLKAVVPRLPQGGAGVPEFQLPRLQSLQRLIQGSVALQVNSGVLGVCMAFLKNVTNGPPMAKDSSKLSEKETEQLANVIKVFVCVCKKAVRVHGRAVGEEDWDFHLQMVEELDALQAEISRFIPSVAD